MVFLYFAVFRNVWFLNNNKVIFFEIPSICPITYVKQLITINTNIPMDYQILIYEDGTEMMNLDSIDEYVQSAATSLTQKALCYLAILPKYWQLLKNISNETLFEAYDSDYNYTHFNKYSQLSDGMRCRPLKLFQENHDHDQARAPKVMPLSIDQIMNLTCGDFVYYRIWSSHQLRDAMIVKRDERSIKLQFVQDLASPRVVNQRVQNAQKVHAMVPTFMRKKEGEKKKETNVKQIEIELKDISKRRVDLKICFGKWWYDEMFNNSSESSMFRQKVAKYETVIGSARGDGDDCRENWLLLQKERIRVILAQYFTFDVCGVLLKYIDCHQQLVQFSCRREFDRKPKIIEWEHGKSNQHKWNFIQSSHPLSLKRNNIFLLKLLNADCNHVKFKRNNHFKFQFEFGVVCFDRLNVTAPDGTISDIKPYQMKQYSKNENKSRQFVGLRMDGDWTQSFIFHNHIPSECQLIQHKKAYEQLVRSKEHPKNGIYLQFENTIYDADKYELSFLVWDAKTEQYEMICNRKYVINTRVSECFVMVAAPVCDCVGTFGFEYVIERIE